MVTDEILTYTAPATKHPFLQISVNGDSPGGTMQIKLFPDKVCPGFLEKGVISILYNIPNGIQKDCHPHPGVAYDGFPKRIAYLPNTFEGRNLLSRFKVCFTRGFMFKVGRSLASGNDHQVRDFIECMHMILKLTESYTFSIGDLDYNSQQDITSWRCIWLS
jgi:deltex-like protein